MNCSQHLFFICFIKKKSYYIDVYYFIFIFKTKYNIIIYTYESVNKNFIYIISYNKNYSLIHFIYKYYHYFQYPFLKSIWKLYEEFDKSVAKDKKNGVYNSLCNVVRGQTEIGEENYDNFCMKLVRNLGPFADNHKDVGLNSERCHILYHWVYYMTMKHNIPDHFTSKIFYKSNEILSASNESRMCPYYSYKENIKEPLNIIKIFNLQNVMKEIESILMQDNPKNSCYCRNFVSECTKIYNRMNSVYCSGENKSHPKNVDTCSQLNTFSTFYEFFIRSNPDLISKLPTLTDGTMNDIIPCDSEKPKVELNSINSEDHEPDRPIKIDTNAVLDTVGSNNIGKQAEYELFHNGPENENISFDQTKYNVAYSPV
ncbi:hypothetical protein PVBG_04793 [Plasmodium vivax Brazil I]|uniref:Variable surface protein n=1 Tax=Plasmodium vivax (strain Brazil I) TaxID=1033975 RepID=A0A0J9T0D1_PLAV1|nr:hypothetical protein PVBG_04793 [Plasmodium vivax Brazil I]